MRKDTHISVNRACVLSTDIIQIEKNESIIIEEN